MTTYRWSAGAHIKGDAQLVGDRLHALQLAHGERLTPSTVVDDARPAESPLHSCFEWDDSRAAERYREDQARDVMRHIRVVTVGSNSVERLQRVFVNVTETVGEEKERGYVPLAKVLASDDLRQQMMVQARKDLIAFKARYAEFSELTAVADTALEQIDLLATKQEAA